MRVAYFRPDGSVELYGEGVDTTVPFLEFIPTTRWLRGSPWYLIDGPQFFRLYLRDLVRVPGLTLRGNPSRLYSAHEPHGVTWIDASPLLADDPQSARQGHRWIERVVHLNHGTVPRSLGAMLLAQTGGLDIDRAELPARGTIYPVPGGVQQRTLRDYAHGLVQLYDLSAAYGAGALRSPVPHGPGECKLHWRFCECHVRVVDCEVSDRSRTGLLPQQTRQGGSLYAGGWYRTIVAEPLLIAALATGVVQLRNVHCVWYYEPCDLSALVHGGWNRRIAATDWYDRSIWKVALQQALGKFGEQPYQSTYAFSPPVPADQWRLVQWESDVWSKDRLYHPPLYHPVAAAWIRQVAQIPLLPLLVSGKCLRVYVDSAAMVDHPLATSETLGGWKLVAEGDTWIAKGAGVCAIYRDGHKVWSAGSPKHWFSLEKTRIDTLLEKRR